MPDAAAYSATSASGTSSCAESGRDHVARGARARPAALARGGEAASRLGVDAATAGADLPRLALGAATRWLRLANDPRTTLPTRRAAEVVRDSYMAMWEELEGAR